MSDLDKKYPLRLDTRINFKNLIPHFYISDNQTNDFYIKLTNDNKPVEVEDIIVVIAVINPNGNINSSFLDTKTEKGLIYCNLPNELKNVVGVYKARIMCISGEERIVSNTFEYKVDTDEFQLIDEITEDSEEMIVLSQMLSRLSNMEIELQTNETERTANENERIANEAERIENENLRQQAEDNRNTTEEVRVVAESNRISNESERVLSEQTRVENEQNRISAENERISNENIRKENENRRLEKENNNIQAELNRVQAESNRVQAELKREQSESNRKNSENARNDNEDIRKQNELKRQSNENTRITNENERIANENERAKVNANRQQAEQTRVTNERNRKEAETARVSAERNRANNESVRISNENIRKNNEEKRKEEFKAKIIEIDNALASLETADGSYPKFINDTILAYIDKDNILERNEIQEGISQALNYVVTCPSGEVTIPDNEMDSSIKNLILTLSDISIELGKSIKVSGAIIFQQNTSFYLYADSNYVEMLFYTSFQCYMVSCYLSEGNTQYDQFSAKAVSDIEIAPVASSGSYNDLTDRPLKVLPTGMTAVDYYNLEIGIYRASGTIYFEYTENCHYYNGLSHFEIFENEIISIEQQHNLVNLSNGRYCWLDETGKITDIGNTSEAWTGELATVATSGSYNDLTDKPIIPTAYNLPVANQTTLGGIKVGAGLSITADGILSATGGATADSVEWANVLGKPTFATVATSGDYNDLTNKPTIPHYNETLMFEISGETDYGNFYANRYFNISALSLDETKSYVGKHKPLMDFPDELIHEFVYNKEANALMDEMNSVYIYNHKSYNGTNFIEDENSAVLTYDIKPMAMSSGYNGYFRLYEIEKLELNNNCLSDDVSIKNSLTVGSRIGDIGKYSVAEGNENTASGGCSHAEGISTIASGDYSHAEGDNTTASGGCSHAEGINTIASGDYSHAESNHTRASGNASHAEGYYTIASTDFQHVQGRLNIEDTGRIYAHIVGNGVSDTERSNAHTLDWNGNAWYQGKLSQDGTPTEDKDLATKKYVDDSIATVNADTIDNLHIWTGTQAQYDALGTKDSNTIYLIKEG